MKNKPTNEPVPALLAKPSFQRLIDLLHKNGYRVLGPTLRDGAVVWDTIRQVSDLRSAARCAGTGSLSVRGYRSAQIFGVVHGPQSLKPLTFAPREPLLQIERTKDGFTVRPTLPREEKIAVLGARACDLAGLAIQDHIFLKDRYGDPLL